MYIVYHPKVDKISISSSESMDYGSYNTEFCSPSFCVWIVPGTVDPNED